MVKRKAGQRLRQQAKARRRELVRERRTELTKLFAGYLALGVSITVFAVLTLPTMVAVFLAGVWLGVGAVMYKVVFDHFDGPGSRLVMGADGESLTADELRRLRRSGWRCVHNVHFEGSDVDHVAIGPGGVVVIESKTSGSDWHWLVREGHPTRWARQAARGAQRIHHLAKQHSGEVVTPLPLVAVWAGGQPSEPELLGNATGISGRHLREHLNSLPPILTEDQVARIYVGLERAARQFDVAAGVRHPGWLRSLVL